MKNNQMKNALTISAIAALSHAEPSFKTDENMTEVKLYN